MADAVSARPLASLLARLLAALLTRLAKTRRLSNSIYGYNAVFYKAAFYIFVIFKEEQWYISIN